MIMTETRKDAIVIERSFDAPIDTIWQLWTELEHFKNWYGPIGFSIPSAQMDVRVGGKRLFCMQSPDGKMTMWLTGEYTEIVPKTRLVYTESMADEHGNILPASALGLPEDTPVITTITVILEAVGERTKMRMTHQGVGVNEPEAAAGWEAAMDKMAARIEAVIADK
jgi:uncharacterized protein YndB with AHSA1/START domain